jgi:putative Holliday junction resolvase
MIASPLELIRKTKFTEDAEALFKLMDYRKVSALVIGLPLNMDGSEGPRARIAREFGDALAARIAVPLEYWDERLSSVEAGERLKGIKMSKGAKRAHTNTVAAQVILESWLRGREGHGEKT